MCAKTEGTWKGLSVENIIIKVMPQVQANTPEDAEGGDVETSISGEKGDGPEDLRQQPLQVVIFLPPPEDRSDLRDSWEHDGCTVGTLLQFCLVLNLNAALKAKHLHRDHE